MMGKKRKTILFVGLALGVISLGMWGLLGYGPAQADENHDRHSRTSSWLIRDGYILTMDGTLGNIDGGDVLVENGKIAKIGHNLKAKPGTKTIDAKNMIVMPGMIDNHRHAWEGIARGAAADLTFGQYFQQILLGTGAKTTPRDNYLGTRLSAYEALNAGVTTLLDWDNAAKSRDYAIAGVDALRDAGVRGVYAYGSPSSNTSGPHPVSQEDIDTVYNYTKRWPLISFAVATNSPELRPGTEDRFFTDVERARKLGVPLTIHIAGFAKPSEPSTVQQLSDRGLLDSDMTFVHANFLSDKDFKLIADAGAHISSSPVVELQMGSIPAPIGRMRAAGVKPTISVDVPTAISGDMFDQMRFLLQVERNVAWNAAPQRPQQLSIFAQDVLPYVTTNAAASVGMSDKIGSLTPGKEADIVLVKGNSLATFLAQPIDKIVHYASPDDVDTVLVAGKIVKRNGQLTGVDLDRLQKEAEAANRRLTE